MGRKRCVDRKKTEATNDKDGEDVKKLPHR